MLKQRSDSRKGGRKRLVFRWSRAPLEEVRNVLSEDPRLGLIVRVRVFQFLTSRYWSASYSPTFKARSSNPALRDNNRNPAPEGHGPHGGKFTVSALLNSRAGPMSREAAYSMTQTEGRHGTLPSTCFTPAALPSFPKPSGLNSVWPKGREDRSNETRPLAGKRRDAPLRRQSAPEPLPVVLSPPLKRGHAVRV